jgi:hypothetical protein
VRTIITALFAMSLSSDMAHAANLNGPPPHTVLCQWGGCTGDSAAAIERLASALVSQLKSPGDAAIRAGFLATSPAVTGGPYACFLVDARNGFGAMNTSWMAIDGLGHAYDRNDSKFGVLVLAACGTKTADGMVAMPPTQAQPAPTQPQQASQPQFRIVQ